MSAAFPRSPTAHDKSAARDFVEGVLRRLSCSDCRRHALEWFQGASRDPALFAGRERLFEGLVRFHNDVNRRIGKRVVSVGEARAIWGGGRG